MCQCVYDIKRNTSSLLAVTQSEVAIIEVTLLHPGISDSRLLKIQMFMFLQSSEGTREDLAASRVRDGAVYRSDLLHNIQKNNDLRGCCRMIEDYDGYLLL